MFLCPVHRFEYTLKWNLFTCATEETRYQQLPCYDLMLLSIWNLPPVEVGISWVFNIFNFGWSNFHPLGETISVQILHPRVILGNQMFLRQSDTVITSEIQKSVHNKSWSLTRTSSHKFVHGKTIRFQILVIMVGCLQELQLCKNCNLNLGFFIFPQHQSKSWCKLSAIVLVLR